MKSKLKRLMDACHTMLSLERNKEAPTTTVYDFTISRTHQEFCINYCASFIDLVDGSFYFKYISTVDLDTAVKKLLALETDHNKLCYVTELDDDYKLVSRVWKSPQSKAYIQRSLALGG